jgi:hypothetical protein
MVDECFWSLLDAMVQWGQVCSKLELRRDQISTKVWELPPVEVTHECYVGIGERSIDGKSLGKRKVWETLKKALDVFFDELQDET